MLDNFLLHAYLSLFRHLYFVVQSGLCQYLVWDNIHPLAYSPFFSLFLFVSRYSFLYVSGGPWHFQIAVISAFCQYLLPDNVHTATFSGSLEFSLSQFEDGGSFQGVTISGVWAVGGKLHFRPVSTSFASHFLFIGEFQHHENFLPWSDLLSFALPRPALPLPCLPCPAFLVLSCLALPCPDWFYFTIFPFLPRFSSLSSPFLLLLPFPSFFFLPAQPPTRHVWCYFFFLLLSFLIHSSLFGYVVINSFLHRPAFLPCLSCPVLPRPQAAPHHSALVPCLPQHPDCDTLKYWRA